MSKFLDAANHPLTFIVAVTLAVTATRKLFYLGASKAGWGGVASFFK